MGKTLLFFCLALVLSNLKASDNCNAETFLGHWETVKLIQVDEGEPWPDQTEVSYPKKLDIKCKNNALVMTMESQFGAKNVAKK
ncbi:hypothetical protein CHISP_2054 [Chitinispirillum alkaliphilum]|nr:hypothetical protein CHISP_2054 [Chitinispirillum alkaliphilum]